MKDKFKVLKKENLEWADLPENRKIDGLQGRTPASSQLIEKYKPSAAMADGACRPLFTGNCMNDTAKWAEGARLQMLGHVTPLKQVPNLNLSLPSLSPTVQRLQETKTKLNKSFYTACS